MEVGARPLPPRKRGSRVRRAIRAHQSREMPDSHEIRAALSSSATASPPPSSIEVFSLLYSQGQGSPLAARSAARGGPTADMIPAAPAVSAGRRLGRGEKGAGAAMRAGSQRSLAASAGAESDAWRIEQGHGLY